MKQVKVFICVLFLGAIAVNSRLFAQLRLPHIITDSMVLQREVKLKIWGWANPGEKIAVQFNGKSYKAKTGGAGKWMIEMKPLKAGGPYTMQISSREKSIVLKDILVGDVWLCSGQSNMEHYMAQHDVLYADEIASVNYPEIRQFKVFTSAKMEGPQNDVLPSAWKWAGPENIRSFTAVGYFFARELYNKYHVPVGIINSSVGGTPIEAWIGEEGFKDFPQILNTILKNKDTAYLNSLARRVNPGARANRKQQDFGTAGPTPWYDVNYISKGWKTIAVPGYWEDQGIKDLNGVVWYRKEVDIPLSLTGKPARVFMGRIVDADVLYINGKQVGSTTYMYPQRRYTVPADILKPGKNIFVIRVTNNGGKGGFVPDKPYYIFSGKDTVDLKGYWQYKVGEIYPLRDGFAGGGGPVAAQNQPTALYNGMIAPITDYSLRGFLWYQGESNTGRAQEYARLQPAQIMHWRSKWSRGDLPFLLVQLPGFMDYNYSTSESSWAEFREAQLKSLSVPQTGMAVAIDLGEWNDIHPDNKKEVGRRLALLARKISYGEDIVSTGPLFQSAEITSNKIILSFTNTGGGLVTSDGEAPAEFAIAGPDKKFMWAKAKIEGDKVIIWNDDLPNPAFVRYGWADNPVNPNLYNREGLPASPFRTDK